MLPEDVLDTECTQSSRERISCVLLSKSENNIKRIDLANRLAVGGRKGEVEGVFRSTRCSM